MAVKGMVKVWNSTFSGSYWSICIIEDDGRSSCDIRSMGPYDSSGLASEAAETMAKRLGIDVSGK